jgi:predicted phage terminase large subunit-like protein
MKIDRKIADTIYQNSFGAFVHAAFEALYPGQRLMPNWHIDTICYAVELMVIGESRNRFVLNLPPRSLKSFIVSVCLPAWLLGRNPGEKIVCASYSRELANKFSRDCRALMGTPFYRRLFPRTRLDPKKSTEGEFETMRRGYRIATSVGGTLTGRGGGVLIVDDPLKADDVNSQVALGGANEWFRSTAVSRLDSPENSLIIVTMQRLHQMDLSGTLIEQGWPCLAIPAIAKEPADFLVGKDEFYHRPTGQVLQPDRDTLEALEEQKRSVGSRIWAAQYDQNPTPPEGNIIKAAWLVRYDFTPAERKFRRIVLSCDPAGKAGIHNDYTAITVCGFDSKQIYLLHVVRGHWTAMEIRRRIETLARESNADLVIIEDTSSGMGLIQMFRESGSLLQVIGRRPDADKEVRMSRHEGRFEAGNILLPKEAPWLADFEAELLAFPHGLHDDQVDALLLFLDWFPKAERYSIPIGPGLPIVG